MLKRMSVNAFMYNQITLLYNRNYQHCKSTILQLKKKTLSFQDLQDGLFLPNIPIICLRNIYIFEERDLVMY